MVLFTSVLSVNNSVIVKYIRCLIKDIVYLLWKLQIKSEKLLKISEIENDRTKIFAYSLVNNNVNNYKK